MSSNARNQHTFNARERRKAYRVIGGLKASLHNPNVSEAAKASAVKRLEELEAGTEGEEEAETEKAEFNLREKAKAMDDEGALRESPATMHRLIGQYKAVLKNPKAPAEAKRQAQEALESGLGE
ncbi:hypothetical protein LshimejAT787_0703140 [Lyophyllum shimeji]|uniref:Conidiation-specific protein 6 n=1 Tax=Lyophyllum shimeji TaxID=47721 RepID=A0A9P3ULY0_LYOSH|nr:hypothetical protein LshimejAT787_0703140 [Lyophyllum shimeji]